MEQKLSLFEEKTIRKAWENHKWYFSIVDAIYALTNLGEVTAVELHKK